MPPSSLAPFRCAVCPASDGLRGVVVGGKQLFLCGEHADKLGDEMPENYDELAAFFALPGIDRRNRRRDRRRADRRDFPRPEMRRHDHGRRGSDPDS